MLTTGALTPEQNETDSLALNVENQQYTATSFSSQAIARFNLRSVLRFGLGQDTRPSSTNSKGDQVKRK